MVQQEGKTQNGPREWSDVDGKTIPPSEEVDPTGNFNFGGDEAEDV